MRNLISLFVIAALLLQAGAVLAETSPTASENQTLDKLAWLAGHWQGGSSGRITEELWLPPAGGLMLGVNRDVDADGKAFFEYLRIEQTNEGVFYRASPQGGDTTTFNLVECNANKAVFENKAHDFPQRISYQMTAPDTLTVTISGEVEGKTESRSWTWTRLSTVATATGRKVP